MQGQEAPWDKGGRKVAQRPHAARSIARKAYDGLCAAAGGGGNGAVVVRPRCLMRSSLRCQRAAACLLAACPPSAPLLLPQLLLPLPLHCQRCIPLPAGSCNGLQNAQLPVPAALLLLLSLCQGAGGAPPPPLPPRPPPPMFTRTPSNSTKLALLRSALAMLTSATCALV